MKLVFLSNYFNHHQKYMSKELDGFSDEYLFISTSEMREERKKLGYGECEIPAYVIEYEKNQLLADNMIEECDCVIFGSAPNKLLKNRIHNGKLIFKYSERLFKNKDKFYKYFPRFVKWHFLNPQNKPLYMLCASAYTPYDYSRYGLFKNKLYKWGYFPQTRTYDIDDLMEKKNKTQILWCGRFLDWKHPDDAIIVAERLKNEGYSFELLLIGNGQLEQDLKQMVADRSLEDRVTFLGAMPPEQVRAYMERSGIYLFTSDRREGWGAVLNESMNSGCAVIADHMIGSVPYLMNNRENGLIYKSGDIDGLYANVKCLLDDPDEQTRLGKEAYKTITETWNAEVAAKRFVNLVQHILSGEKYPDLYESGPCSRAEIINEEWFCG